MGSDQLFHRKRALTKDRLRRNKASRVPQKTILLVCEGEKTEKIYFDYIKEKYKLTSFHVRIHEECDSAPISVVNYAESLLECDDIGKIDSVCCLFDRDTHTTFSSALDKVRVLNKKIGKKSSFIALYSIPCFEYWFLLHFKYTRSAFSASKGKSASDCVSCELRRISIFHDYDKKTTPKQLAALFELTDTAIANAKKAVQDFEQTGDDNPLTYIHLLVEDLKNNNTNNINPKK